MPLFGLVYLDKKNGLCHVGYAVFLIKGCWGRPFSRFWYNIPLPRNMRYMSIHQVYMSIHQVPMLDLFSTTGPRR